jgi:hypothetical protein
MNVQLQVDHVLGASVGEAMGVLREVASLDWQHAQVENRRWLPAERLATISADARSVKLFCVRGAPEAGSAHAILGEGEVLLALNYGEQDVPTRAATLLDDIEMSIRRLRTKLGNNGSRMSARVLLAGINRRRLRPGRQLAPFSHSSVLDAFAEVTDAVSSVAHSLPTGVVSTQNDGLLVLRWIAQLNVPRSAMAKALEDREVHLARSLLAPVLQEWNAFGDQFVHLPGVAPHPNVALYQRAMKSAYVTGATETEIQEILRSAADWLARGTLPDGSAIVEVTLVVPNRELAKTVYQKARDAGIKGVLYPRSEGGFWNPFPEGEWLSLDVAHELP